MAQLRAASAWVRASAFRKSFAATIALSMVVASVMTLAGYLSARRVIQQSVLSELSARTEVAAIELELTVGGLMGGARALAQNGFITNALVDSEGRDQYVRPVLRDFAAAAPAPIQLVVVDFRGRPIASSLDQGSVSFAGATWLPSLIDRGEARVVVERAAAGPSLLFVQPIIFPGTERAEGALVTEIPLAPILARFAGRRPEQVFDLLDSEAPIQPSGEATLGAPLLVAERNLTLGGAGGMRLRVGIPHGVAFRGLHRFALVTAIGVLAMLALVLVAVWLIASRLTQGVRELSFDVAKAAAAGPVGVRVPASGEDEVAALGTAFNVLLARLEEASAARLAEQVERREGAERDLRLAREAVEQAVEAIEVVTADGRIAFANGAAARRRGLTRGEAVGQRWEALFDRDLDWWSGLWARLQRERAAEVSLRIRQEAETIPVVASLVYFELDGQEHCIATTRDVRERLRAEATERLASLGTLAAGVAHEINNPLAYVLGNLTYLREGFAAGGGAGEEERRALDEALHGAERVRDVVRSLRAYSRSGGEGPPLRVDVAAEVRGALRLVGSTLRHRARIVEEIAEVPPVVARSNELGQVFVNLLVNAAQAVRPDSQGGAEIGVRTFEHPAGRVGVEVIDNGVGIPPDVQRRIFEPFFTTKPVGDGTGLGLSICHGIVTRLGGTIAFESEPGKGTRFTVLLPAATPIRVSDEGEEEPLPRGRILVVDDDPAVTRALARMLGRSAEVSIETSPESALARLATDRAPDAILCDVMMPGLTGPMFHARLRDVDAELARRVVFITGGAVTEEIARAVSATDQPCVDKPPERAALARAIAAVRDRGRAGPPATGTADREGGGSPRPSRS